MSNLKYKLEALLFSSARSMKIEELCNLTKANPEEIREKLNELKKEYEQRDSSITLIDEGNAFKLNIKSEHIPIVQKIVTETELSKTLMETLAVIAFKYPIKQSDLIKIRTNKAYDHLRNLEEMGYITRQKYSRTKLIKLTSKFFEYFDLPPEKLKEKFSDFSGIAKAIKEKEEEIKKMKEEMKKKAEEASKKEKKEEKEIDLIDEKGHKEKLAIYEKPEEELEKEEAEKIKPYTEKLGNLEVTDVPEKEEQEETEEILEGETEEKTPAIEMTEEMGEEVVEKIKEEIKGEKETTKEKKKETEEPPKEEPKPTEEQKTPKEVESEVDKKVEELLHPKEETTKEKETKEKTTKPKEKTTEEPSEEEPKDLLEAAAEEEEKKKEEQKQNENIPP